MRMGKFISLVDNLCTLFIKVMAVMTLVPLKNNARPQLLFPDNNNDNIGSAKLTMLGKDSEVWHETGSVRSSQCCDHSDGK